MNPALRCVYVESHEERGGDPATVHVRGLETSLPLTLRNNYSDTGYLISDTEARDIVLIEEQFQQINHNLRMGVTVCLPTMLLSEELNYLEKHTPKVEQYLLKRLSLAKTSFPLLEL
jgi:hypothetical protein|tara:strand:+ start:423 stop:773 length:351 start_codon:yes stop_codon:yes gene_type:complete